MRKILKQAFTRFETYFNALDLTSNTLNLEELRSRLIKAEPALDEYEVIQQTIELLDDDFDVNYVRIYEPERVHDDYYADSDNDEYSESDATKSTNKALPQSHRISDNNNKS
ncbi:unnamed protein product [Ceutorhynchus assimilis]|uniref:Uncharacterized protein n=1 Tax=Ceutorhynchus assimilis TaxID=467358 RepID=A0A9N9MW49_9CUCU|nr:unnamed protein product [Ceutorhynchus assimilis]